MNDLLPAAKATPFMSSIDLKCGYWQNNMSDNKKQKQLLFLTASTIQRVIDKFRYGLPENLVLAYRDNIIICSEDFASHITDLRLTFKRLQNFCSQLNRIIYLFCFSEIYILTINGLKWSEQMSLKDFCRLHHFCNK